MKKIITPAELLSSEELELYRAYNRKKALKGRGRPHDPITDEERKISNKYVAARTHLLGKRNQKNTRKYRDHNLPSITKLMMTDSEQDLLKKRSQAIAQGKPRTKKMEETYRRRNDFHAAFRLSNDDFYAVSEVRKELNNG